MLSILKNTTYDKGKYLEEQESFSVLKNTEIINMMSKIKVTAEEMPNPEIIEKNSVNEEIVDFLENKRDKIIRLKSQEFQGAINNLEKYIDYQKKYNVSREKIYNNIANTVKDKKKALQFNLPITELEEKYKWFLEQEENVELQKTNYSKLESIDKYWENGINSLEKTDKNSYLENISISLYENENRDFKNYIFKILDKKINRLGNEIEENQKSYYYEKDYDVANKLYANLEENIDFEKTINEKIDDINLKYSFIKEKGKNLIGILSSIEEVDLNLLKKDIERDITENIDEIEDIINSYADNISVENIDFNIKELGKNINLSKKDNSDTEINSKIERVIALKNIETNKFDIEDIKPITKSMKTLIEDRENAIKYNRPYLSYKDFEENSNKDFEEKTIISKFLNTVDLTDVKIEPCRLNIDLIDNVYLSSITTPQFIASFETNKIGNNKIDNILYDLAENFETNYNLKFIEKLYSNSENIYNLAVRDNIRHIGENFYKDFIFSKDIGFGKTIEIDKNMTLYLEKTEIEREQEREKMLGLDIEFTEKEIELEKINEIEKENKNRFNEFNLSVDETRDRIMNYLIEYPMIRENLIMLEEIIDDKKLLYGYNSLDESLNNTLKTTFEYLIREELYLDTDEDIQDEKALEILENINKDNIERNLQLLLELKEQEKIKKQKEIKKSEKTEENYISKDDINKVIDEKEIDKNENDMEIGG